MISYNGFTRHKTAGNGHGYLKGPGAINPGFTGAAPRQCQFIAIERPPGKYTEADKCLKPAEPGRPYCAECCARCYIPIKLKPKAQAA